MSVYTMDAAPLASSSDSSSSSSGDGSVDEATPDGDGYMGCFTDIRRERVLRSDTKTSDAMTARRCKDYCGERGSSLCGLQYGEE